MMHHQFVAIVRPDARSSKVGACILNEKTFAISRMETRHEPTYRSLSRPSRVGARIST